MKTTLLAALALVIAAPAMARDIQSCSIAPRDICILQPGQRTVTGPARDPSTVRVHRPTPPLPMPYTASRTTVINPAPNVTINAPSYRSGYGGGYGSGYGGGYRPKWPMTTVIPAPRVTPYGVFRPRPYSFH